MIDRPWPDAAAPVLLVLLAVQRRRRAPSRLHIGNTTATSGGQRFHIHYLDDLSWSVHREGVHLGTMFLEDWTHYSYFLPGNDWMPGPETSTNWRTTLRALAAA